MKQRNHKRTISILLAVFFIKSFAIFFGMSVPLHMVMGGIAALLSVVHVCVNRKWLSSIRKARKTGSLNQKTKWQYRVDLLLILSWSVCILSGVLIGFPGILSSLAGIEDLFLFFVTHLLSAILSLLLVIVHVAQHGKHIHAYFKKKTRTVRGNTDQNTLSIFGKLCYSKNITA